MLSFLKGASFWLWLAIIASALSGTYLLGREAGREKEITRWASVEQKRLEAVAKALVDENKAQANFNEEVEPVIVERIVERTKWRTHIEKVIVNNPAPDSCSLSDELFKAYNRAVRQANTGLPD